MNIIVTIKAEGDRASGKSTLLKIIRGALIAKGYDVSEIDVWGDEVIYESIDVVTATKETKIKWMNKQLGSR